MDIENQNFWLIPESFLIALILNENTFMVRFKDNQNRWSFNNEIVNYLKIWWFSTTIQR